MVVEEPNPLGTQIQRTTMVPGLLKYADYAAIAAVFMRLVFEQSVFAFCGHVYCI